MEELQIIRDKIYEVRGQRVMLDHDLAQIYQVQTRVLNQTVKRNKDRFPCDFMFQITEDEWAGLMSSQSVMTSRSKRPKSSLPYVFSEQGVALLSGLLNSDVAIKANIAIMRAFVSMKTYLAARQDESPAIEELRRRVEALEQSPSHPPQLTAGTRPLPERLSEGVKVWIYSERALLILTDDPDDRRLLKSLGARYNHWLTLKGEPTAGWVFPRSRQKVLEKYLPEKHLKD